MEDSTKVRGCKVFNMADVVHSTQFCSMIAMIACVFLCPGSFMIHLEPHGHWGMKIDENSQQREGSKSDLVSSVQSRPAPKGDVFLMEKYEQPLCCAQRKHGTLEAATGDA